MGGGGSSFMDVIKYADPTYYANQDKAFGQDVGKPGSEIVQTASVATGGKPSTPVASAPITPKAVAPVKESTAEVAGSAAVVGRRKPTPTRTTYTSPLGIGGMASTSRKILLGQ
jgi:hypothetical protein